MKFIDRWRQEWWLKHAAELAKTFEENRLDLIQRGRTEIEQTQETWANKKESLLQRIRLEEEEIKYRLESLEHRKSELARVSEELRNQIKIMEAKAHPSEVWAQAFTAGVTKSWDLIQPFMLENIEKMKKQIYDEALTKAIGNLNGNHKKNH